jgi:hypothetical protein
MKQLLVYFVGIRLIVWTKTKDYRSRQGLQFLRVDLVDFRSKDFAKRVVDVGVHLFRVLGFDKLLVVMNNFDFEAGLVLAAADR